MNGFEDMEMAWEHKCEDGCQVLRRVLFYRIWNGRRVRCSNWYGTAEDAAAQVEKIRLRPLDFELISISEYRLSGDSK